LTCYHWPLPPLPPPPPPQPSSKKIVNFNSAVDEMLFYTCGCCKLAQRCQCQEHLQWRLCFLLRAALNKISCLNNCPQLVSIALKLHLGKKGKKQTHVLRFEDTCTRTCIPKLIHIAIHTQARAHCIQANTRMLTHTRTHTHTHTHHARARGLNPQRIIVKGWYYNFL
jgi:hypothetical protein